MIGAHDCFTYLKARYRIFELFAFMWRTQTKSILEQAQAGVIYFDIRVRREKNKWRVCHGLVDFPLTFDTIIDIVRYFNTCNAINKSTPYLRVILERGTGEDIFEAQINDAIDTFTNSHIVFVCIKKGWRVILNNDPKLVDQTFVPFLSNLSFIQNIKRGKFWNTIKRYAKKYPITSKEKKSKTVYFKDYV